GFHKFAQKMALPEKIEPTEFENERVSVMDVYLTVRDYRSAILYWNDIDELNYLLAAYEAINYDDANIIPHLNYLFEHLPSNYEIQLLDSLRKAYLAQNDTEASIRTINMAIKLAPKSSNLWTCLVEIHIANGDRDQAIALLHERLSQTPTVVGMWDKL